MSAPIRIGKYTVRASLRFDNPAFPVYLVYAGEKLVGRTFSMPDEDQCRGLEARELQREADALKPPPKLVQMKRRGRPPRADLAIEEAEEIN